MKIKLLILLIFATSLYGHKYSLKNGWQMLGAVHDIKDMGDFNTSDLNNSCVKSVWRYNNIDLSWEVYIPFNDNINTLQSLDEANGFWVDADDDCYIDLSKNISFHRLYNGDSSTNSDLNLSKRFQVIQDFQVFEYLYQNHVKALMITQPDIPFVDFENEIVLAVFMGEQGSGQYYIKILSIKEYNDYIEVELETIIPGNGCTVTEALTSPVDFVTIPKTDKKIIFKEYSKMTDIDSCIYDYEGYIE